MAEIADLEGTLLETVRSLPQSQQEAVLNFARSLSQNLASLPTVAAEPLQPLPLSLQQIAKLPIGDRHKLIAPYIAAMVDDFQTDPELTEFSVLDTEDWED